MFFVKGLANYIKYVPNLKVTLLQVYLITFIKNLSLHSIKDIRVRDRKNLGPLRKEIWVLVRAPLFSVVVWSRHLFFIQKIRKINKYNYMFQIL